MPFARRASLVEHDHRPRGVALLHLVEALVDPLERDRFGDDAVEVEQSAQVEIDEARDVDREAVAAHDRALQFLARQQVHRAEPDLFAERHHAEDRRGAAAAERCDRKARRGRPARSEEHTSELQSLMRTSYAVFCLKKKTPHTIIKPKRTHTYTPRTSTNTL